MNWLRLLLAICVNFYLEIASRSPNQDNEMGKQNGDKPDPNGKANPITRHARTVITPIAFIVYGYHYADKPLHALELLCFVVATFGILLRVWAYRTLKSYFTFTVGIRKDHQIVTTGPYRWLIHPSYTGQTIVNIASLLFLRFPLWGVLLVAVYMVIVVLRRIQIEENCLKEHFGKAYEDFMKSRNRLIPYIY